MELVVLPSLGLTLADQVTLGRKGIHHSHPQLTVLGTWQDQAQACLGKLDRRHSLSPERLPCHWDLGALVLGPYRHGGTWLGGRPGAAPEDRTHGGSAGLREGRLCVPQVGPSQSGGINRSAHVLTRLKNRAKKPFPGA